MEVFWSLVGLIGALCLVSALFLVYVATTSIQDRIGAIGRLEAKLDLLLKHAGIEYDPWRDVPLPVKEALQRGPRFKIDAIKRYREATGAGLKEAKDYIEELQRRMGSGV